MADLDIAIAGRNYRVACADGEEENLTEAARLVAAEAESLREQFGTRFAALPETRMLLMASLMLGDRFRAHLAEEAAALAGAPAAEEDADADANADPAAPSQAGFFDDPVQGARIEALEAELAAARENEQAALAALEAAAERIRALAGEIAEEDLDEEDLDEEEVDEDDLDPDDAPLDLSDDDPDGTFEGSGEAPTAEDEDVSEADDAPPLDDDAQPPRG